MCFFKIVMSFNTNYGENASFFSYGNPSSIAKKRYESIRSLHASGEIMRHNGDTSYGSWYPENELDPAYLYFFG